MSSGGGVNVALQRGSVWRMEDRSLITDEVRSYVGRTTELRPVTVSPEAVARAAEVCGTEVDGDRAPGFVLMSLVPEGQALRIPLSLPTSILISNEFALERPLRVGEQLQARSRIADVSERLGGQFGHGVYVRSDVEFFDLDGVLVGRSASTLMYYDPAGAQRIGGQE